MSNVSGAVKSIQDIMRKDVGVDGDAQRISQMVWMIFLKIYDDREEELELTEDGFTSPIPERFRWRNWAQDREGITGDALVKFVEDLFVTLKTQLPTIGDVGKRAQVMAAHQALVEALLATLTASADAADLATNWERLEAHFDTLFTTESSVDALKRTFLDLAVRGKLVEQDAGDEPAQTAFDRIITLKKKLILQKKIRKDKPSAVIDELDLPFPLPTSWIWCRIGEVALSTEYGTSRKAFSGQDGIAILAMGNIQNGAVNLESDKVIPRDSDEFPELLLRYGDILYNRTNSYELVGKTGIFRHQTPDYSFASYLIRIRLDERSLEPEFLNIAMNTPYFRQTQVVPRITKQTGQANVSGGAMRNMLVPFPPVAEQQRIVVKVGELMALCDELKVRLADAGETQKHLADAIVERAAA